MTPRERRVLLAVLGSLTFTAVYASVVISPVLTQIASEFGITTGTAGLVVAAYGAPGVLVALLSGPYSDRFGRRRFLIAGSAVMGVFTLAGAFATSFPVLLALRAVAGIGASLIYPNVSATVGDNFAYRDRGRVMSTVIGFNTMASVLGVPVAGIIAEATSWRISLITVGVLSMAATLLLYFLLRPARVHVSETRFFELYRTVLRSRSAVAAIISSFLGSLYWFAWATYIVVFFEQVYGLTRGNASTIALTLGLGVLIGSQVGGRLGDRIGHKPVVATAIIVSAVVLLVLTNFDQPLFVAAGLNLVLSTVIGARFATNQTLMTEQMPAARGTLLAISGALASLSIVVASSVGGILIDAYGFWAIGIFCFVCAFTSMLVVLIFVREEPIDVEFAPL